MELEFNKFHTYCLASSLLFSSLNVSLQLLSYGATKSRKNNLAKEWLLMSSAIISDAFDT